MTDVGGGVCYVDVALSYRCPPDFSFVRYHPRTSMFVASRLLCRSHLAAVSRSSGMATASRPVLRGVIFDMDGTLTKPNLDFTEMYRRVASSEKHVASSE